VTHLLPVRNHEPFLRVPKEPSETFTFGSDRDWGDVLPDVYPNVKILTPPVPNSNSNSLTIIGLPKVGTTEYVWVPHRE